jgi:kumamolisin
MSLRIFYQLGFLLPTALLAVNAPGAAHTGERFVFSGSVKAVSSNGSLERGRISRSVLRTDELQASMHVVVSMELRNAVEFHNRIDGGEKITQSELLSKYLPLQSDYERVVVWLKSEGFVMDETVDSNRMNIFAHHSVADVSRVFQVNFARVLTNEGEFTSAVTSPSVPAEYGTAILGILGLQPHIRYHRDTYVLGRPSHTGCISPTDMRVAYNVPSNLTGAGQAIAVIMQGPGPMASDLTTFWTACNVPQSIGNYTCIPINGGIPSPTGSEFEGSLDVEWASGMAPGAAVRFYDIPELDDIDAVAALTQVNTDRLTVPNLNVVTMSFGSSEAMTTADDNLAFHNIFGILQNEGVTLLASSGDGGSNPDASGATNNYGTGANFPLDVEYPASDPYVTSVGGTDLELNSDGSIEVETAWFLDTDSSNGASGGGISSIYARPSWQVGASLPAGNTRLVPDVAADAFTGTMSSQSMFVIYENSRSGNLPFSSQTTGGAGTSFSSPIWAGICACLNQARQNAGQASLGLLGPKIYPLLGTSAFHDITASGTRGNGAYAAGVGYDYLTGLGSPNVTNLVADLVHGVINPDFTSNGSADILWQNMATGDRGIYLMNGTSVAGWTDLGTISPQWRIAGTGDFNQDGNIDILWQNSVTGDCGIYLMRGTTVTGWVDLGTVPVQWRIVGVADFNGDGYPDILWQNTATGDCGIYLMNGMAVAGWVDIGTYATQWRIAGVADFNGDGNPDILWQNSVTGLCGFYLMNGTTVSSWAPLGTLPVAWQIAAVADYNGDGKPDILWQNTVTGQSGFYIMNGTSVVSWVGLGTSPTAWQIAP